MCWLALFLFLSVSTRDKRDEINIFVAGDPCRKEYHMLKVFATQVVVSRGYDGAAAIKFSEKGDAVRFRIGKKVYDPNAENNARWINLRKDIRQHRQHRQRPHQQITAAALPATSRLAEAIPSSTKTERQQLNRAYKRRT